MEDLLKLLGKTKKHDKTRLPAGFIAREEVAETRPARGKRGPSSVPYRLIVGAMALVVVACVLAATDYLVNAGGIHRGVSAGEVSLGGLSKAEVRSKLEDHASENLDELVLRGRGDAKIPADSIDLRLDAAATAERAYAVGREENFPARLWHRLRASFGGFGIEPAVDYDPEKLRTEVEEATNSTGGDSREADIRVENGGVELVGGRGGYEVDVAATTGRAEEAILDLSRRAEIVGEEIEPAPGEREEREALERARLAVEEPLVLEHEDSRWTLSPERVAAALTVSGGEVGIDRDALGRDLSEALGTLERKPVDARMISGEKGSVEVEPARGGREVQTGRLLDGIEAGIFEGRHRYEVPVSTVEPDPTTEEAEAARPNTMLGEFETSYLVYDEPPRVQNLKTASGAVDGTIIAPGETFSFNETAAPISRYEPSDVIVDGRIDTALGGGLCQVASTLYMAANYAGLEIAERHPHYAELPYIRPGFDATVWFGALDLKLRNNTGGYLLLEERVDEETGKVVSRVYGQSAGREVEMSSRKFSEDEQTTRWRSTRKVVEDGEVVESGTLNDDTYQPLEPQAPAPTGRGA